MKTVMTYIKTSDLLFEIKHDGDTTTMIVPANIPVYQIEEGEDEVTHEVFFCENIKRVMNTLFK